MIWIKRWVKDFFFLSHSQVNGFFVLVPLLALILFSAPAWKWIKSQRPKDYTKDHAKLDSLVALWDKPKHAINEAPSATDVVRIRRSLFDPNYADSQKLTSLGFSSALSHRIVRYREKGGRFRIKSDVLKIYGMDSSLYHQLVDYIDLPTNIQSGRKQDSVMLAPLVRIIPTFDLNQADTLQLKGVYGIGQKLSARIVKYRDALGGFVTMDQVSEIYGLDSAVVKRLATASFIDSTFQPRKLNINTAEERELAAHPYLKKTVARSIVTYRFQHGEFKSLGDLSNIHALDPETIRKIAPYLTLEE